MKAALVTPGGSRDHEPTTEYTLSRDSVTVFSSKENYDMIIRIGAIQTEFHQ